MSRENVEVIRRGVEAWNQQDADLWLSHAAPEIEWMPAGPATVERAVYRGYEEVASGFAAVWETWEGFASRSPRSATSGTRCSGSGA
ncbi:MAG: nuclear transport factor 2 family protein [Thermoleophilaceae bacterium]|nr:nuclear transport factor 2 family protein [Thermoleophilaceae bacterium]